MLHECLRAAKIPLAVAAPELAGVCDRLEVLPQSGGVGKAPPTLAAIAVAVVLVKLIHGLAAGRASLYLPGG